MARRAEASGRRGWLCACIFALSGSAAAAPQSWRVDPEGSEVRFTSDWPLRVTGQTRKVRGSVRGDLAELSSVRAEFSADPSSIKTGIERRDKTMREKCLETDKYPEIRFELRGILSNPGTLAAGTSAQILAAGTFDLHGVRKDAEIAVEVLAGPEPGLLRARSRFPMLLSDYGIFRPRIMLMKFADRVFVQVDALLRPEAPSAPAPGSPAAPLSPAPSPADPPSPAPAAPPSPAPG